jgi:hypothetical protein
VFTSGQNDDLMAKVDGDRILMSHHTGVTWELAFEQLNLVNNGIVLPRGATATSAPLQAVALNQLAIGPARWMPPEAPGQTRPAASPGR